MYLQHSDTNSNQAELIALNALTWLAGDATRLEGFMRTTGINLETLRAAAGEPGLLASVLDHVLQDERLLLAWCRDEGHDAAKIRQFRQRLPGHDVAG